MTYGLNVFNANGTLGYSTDDVTWNQVDIFYLAGGASTTREYPVLSGKEHRFVQILINSPPLDAKAIVHVISRPENGITVTAAGGSEDAYILVLMR